MTAENLGEIIVPASSVSLLLQNDPSIDVRSLISSSHSTLSNQTALLDSQLLSSLPSTLSSHNSLSESLSTLSNLHTLLSSFSTSLSSASSQISVLQQRSSLIDKRLKARERLEKRLNNLLNKIVIQPDVVKLLFDTKPLPGKDGKDEINQKWRLGIDQLDRVLQATSELEQMKGGTKKGKDKEVDAMTEARNAAEACRIVKYIPQEALHALGLLRWPTEGARLILLLMILPSISSHSLPHQASTKLLPYLLSLLSPLRTSVISNHLILQSIILLKHSHPFYSFLARHSPRVAIDFQKGYASNARLYFETGFRRYRRSLDKLMRKGWGKWEAEEKGGMGEVGNAGLNPFAKSNSQSSDPSPKPGASRPPMNSSNSDRPSSAEASASKSSETDTWLPDLRRLDNSKLEDGPGIVLAYQADESGFRAPPEALFRSLALVFVDNACSEYVFIVRFFENAILNPNADPSDSGIVGSSSKSRKAGDTGSELEDDANRQVQVEEDDEEDEGMNPVALNRREIKIGNSRPAADEMWKQVMEPVLGHWNSFTKSLLAPSPSLLSLLTMLTLNDRLIALADLRGCSSILQSPLLGFKLQTWPLVQKAFEVHIDSLKRVNGGGSEVDTSAGLKGFASGWGMGGMMRAALDATGAGQGGDDLKEEHVRMICARYSRIFSSVTLLSDGQEDGMLSSSLNRLRIEIEKFISHQSSRRSSSQSGFARSMYGVILSGLENGPAPTVHPRIQSELSLWHELETASS